MSSALIFYQYFYPDDVVSAIHLTELAQGLTRRGWTVKAISCNRSCRNKVERHPKSEMHNGISIRRIWRPPFPQASSWGRFINCAWMIAAWSLRSLIDKPDVLIIGTDPVMSALTVLPWKLTQSRTKAIHWCFDLYPEAALAAGIIRPGVAASLLRSLVGSAYKRFDLIADIGDCMRERISLYKSPAKQTTLAPWALAEPASALPIDVEERKAIFGNASLGLMYSGNFGRPHSYGGLLTLARAMRDADAHFALSIRGNRASEFQHAVRTDDHNVSFVPFAPQEHLEKRLSAADIQIISLRNEWTGTVVPSKFFGALAAGRPVLFFGSERSYISRTIRNHQLGWVCSPGNEPTVAAELRAVAQNPSSLKELSERCHRVYCETFARDLVLDRFDRELRALLGEAAAEQIKDFAETTASVPLQS